MNEVVEQTSESALDLRTGPAIESRYPFDDRSITVVFGTRPELIKLAGIIRLLGPAARLVSTGQHYSPSMVDPFFDQLRIPRPDIQLEVGGRTRGQQIASGLAALDDHLRAEPTQAVVVQGDTNATVAGALAANALDIPLAHVEAGLRSHDRRMPEEHNRVVTDHLSDLCCAPTRVNSENLRAEGIDPDRIVETGNTVVEAVTELLPPEAARRELLADLGLSPSGFVLATIHRPENVDEPGRLEEVMSQLGDMPLPTVFPVHPRTRNRIDELGLGKFRGLRLIEPLGYEEFLGLASECALLVSDSGGVQEESSVIKRPVIVVRRSTERPEVHGTFARLAPPGPEIGRIASEWINGLDALHRLLVTQPCPYGDGTASARSVDALASLLESGIDLSAEGGRNRRSGSGAEFPRTSGTTPAGSAMREDVADRRVDDVGRVVHRKH